MVVGVLALDEDRTGDGNETNFGGHSATNPASRNFIGRDNRRGAEHQIFGERGGDSAILVLLEKAASVVFPCLGVPLVRDNRCR